MSEDVLNKKEKQIKELGEKIQRPKVGEQKELKKRDVLAEPCVPGATTAWNGVIYTCNENGKWRKEGKKFTLPDQQKAQAGIDRIFGKEK